MSRLFGLLPLLAVGCGTPGYAVVNGKRVERPTLAYDNGQTFHLEHRRAYPGVFDPARGRDVDDGSLRGRICGVDVEFDASWYGARLQLDGRADVPWKQDFTHTEGIFRLELEVTELGPGHRRIRSVGQGIDLDVSPERMDAWIGRRHFLLTPDGGYLAGRYQRTGDVLVPIDDPFAIWGREALATMVPADEALLLVLMLTCDGTIDYDGAKVRGFTLVPVRPRS